jgi:hypothetical protein
MSQMILVSYTGSKDSRIIQAHYDGTKLHLQIAPLFQMVDEKTAPIDLFLRYTVGMPVGKTLCEDTISELKDWIRSNTNQRISLAAFPLSKWRCSPRLVLF